MNAQAKKTKAARLCSALTLAGALLILLSTVLWIVVGSTKDTSDSLADVRALCQTPKMWRYFSEEAALTGEGAVTVKAEVVNGALTLSSAYTADGVSYDFKYEPAQGKLVARYYEDMVADGSRVYRAVYEYSDKARSEGNTLAAFSEWDGNESMQDTLHAAAEEFAIAACALIAANTPGGLSVLWLILLLLGMLTFAGFGIAALILKKAPAVDETRNVWGDRIR